MYRFVLDITEMLDRQNYSDFAKFLDQELLLLFNKKFVKNQKGNNTYTNNQISPKFNPVVPSELSNN